MKGGIETREKFLGCGGGRRKRGRGNLGKKKGGAVTEDEVRATGGREASYRSTREEKKVEGTILYGRSCDR